MNKKYMNPRLRKKVEKARLIKTYNETKHSYGAGVYYSEEKHRYIRYKVSRRTKKSYNHFLKRYSNRRIRRYNKYVAMTNSEIYTKDKSRDTHKYCEYWWLLY